MFKNIMKFFKKANKKEIGNNSKETAKERLHLVLMQDRANVSADFLDLMRREIIEVIKKYIDIDEEAMDVSLKNQENEDGTQGAPALYANIPIINIKEKAKKLNEESKTTEEKVEEKNEEIKPTNSDIEEKEEKKEEQEEKVQEKNNSEKESKDE